MPGTKVSPASRKRRCGGEPLTHRFVALWPLGEHLFLFHTKITKAPREAAAH